MKFFFDFRFGKSESLLVLILVLGALLRFSSLLDVPPSLFSDEVDIAYQVTSLLETGKDYQGNSWPLQIHSFSDVRTSIPIYLTLLVSLIPGVSVELAVRLVPAIAGIAGIWITYFFVNGLFNSTNGKIGLLASLLLVITPWHFHYSRIGFEVSLLYVFLLGGVTLFMRFAKSGRDFYLWLSLFLLSLTPMVYSTAKLGILFVPFLLLSLSGWSKKYIFGKKMIVFWVLLFVPLIVVVMDGGATKRFNEISVFSDPTVSTDINFRRQALLGANPEVGSSPSLLNRVAYNKFVSWSNTISNNILLSLSTNFLFINGDRNLRHSEPGYGVLYKMQFVLVVAGLAGLFICSKKHKRVLSVLFWLIVMSVVPASITGDGGNHATRLFLLVIPMVILSAWGIVVFLRIKKILVVPLILLLVFESFLYFYYYFTLYGVDSQRDWHAGMKEMVLAASEYKDVPVIISHAYEPPLIFYLYYAGVDPAKLQQIFNLNELYGEINQIKTNLNGVRFAKTNVIFASIDNLKNLEDFVISPAIYYLTAGEVENKDFFNDLNITKIIRLPSGEELFYEITN